jgi:cytochrome b pre-mRNA-processing protein 3
LYVTLVTQSREPSFYTDCGVADSVDGRFDMIAIHCFLVMNRLKGSGKAAGQLSQVLFDEMFNDMDRGLRELGVGDMGVGKRVRAMAKAYMGRVDAYDRALEEGGDALEAALQRNLYRGDEHDPSHVRSMADYMRREQAALVAQADADLLAGRVSFGPAPLAGGT